MGPDLEPKSSPEHTCAPSYPVQNVQEPGTKSIADARGVEALPIVQTPLSSRNNEDEEVDITGWFNPSKAFVEADSFEDATEDSSSFGDTVSGAEDSSKSDNEIESRMCADNVSSSMSSDWSELLQKRKRRMTIHWRRFINPLTWRCKWLELQMKQLQSLNSKYNKELAAYNYTKQLDFAHITLDGSAIKSVPISGRMHRNKFMRRRKRNRVEEQCDIASYMSKHNLFSYYENTDHTVNASSYNFHGVTVGGSHVVDKEEIKLNDMWPSEECENNDRSLDDIIQKIEAVHSHVHQLKTRIDKVISENPERFRSVTQLSMPGGPLDGFNHSGPTTTSSSGRERKAPLIETTDRLELEDPMEDDDEEALQDYENIRNHPYAVHEKRHCTESVQKNAVSNVHSTLNPYSTSKSKVPTTNKRKSRKKYGSNSKRWQR